MRTITMALIVLCGTTLPAEAAWFNYSGKVDKISVYGERDTVLVKLVPHPNLEGLPAGCTGDFFALSASWPVERRQQMLSVLLSAQASGRTVTIAYDDAAACASFSANVNFPAIVRVILDQ